MPSMEDSDFARLGSGKPKRGVSFDPTINLGHVLTFVGLLATLIVGYFDLRERITVNEERTARVQAEVHADRGRNEATLKEVREDVRDVRRGVNDLLQRKEK